MSYGGLVRKFLAAEKWGRATRSVVMALAALGSLVVPAAHAQDANPASQEAISVKLTQQQVVIEDGKEKLKDVSSVKPGDVVEYRAVYTNNSKADIKDLVATLPIADGLDYLARTAKASQGLPAARVALRDGRTGAEPMVVVEDGKKVEVPAAEYRSLHWRVGSLAAGKSVSVSARATVSMFPIDAQAAPASAGSSVVPLR